MTDEATSADLRRRLEELSDRAVPGIHRATIGDWQLRAANGVTGRANSAWVRGESGLSPAATIEGVTAWYRDHGLGPRLQVFADAGRSIDAELDRRGWERSETSLVMVVEVDGLLEVAGRDTPWPVEVRPEATPRFAGLVDRDRLTEVTTTTLPQRFASVVDDGGRTLGGAIATVDGSWVNLSSISAVPEARRRGVATDAMAALGDAARRDGARTAWLQVEAGNTPAVSLYQRLGFDTAHVYHYRRAPAG